MSLRCAEADVLRVLIGWGETPMYAATACHRGSQRYPDRALNDFHSISWIEMPWQHGHMAPELHKSRTGARCAVRGELSRMQQARQDGGAIESTLEEVLGLVRMRAQHVAMDLAGACLRQGRC